MRMWFAVAVLLATAAPASAKAVDVFFYSGQSNASGRATTGYVPDARDAQTLYYYRTDGPGPHDVTSGGEFTILGPLDTGYYGAEVRMGRALVDEGFAPAIIKISDGGTSLAGGWTSRRDGVWWSHWKSDVADAMSDLEAQGYTINVRAFFWMQGESDADAYHGPNYAENLRYFVEDSRAYLATLGYASSDMAFVTALIQDFNPPHSKTVRNAQVQVMETVKHGGWFDTADLNLLDDIHFDAAGVDTLGRRFVDEYLTVLNAPEPSSLGLLLSALAIVSCRCSRSIKHPHSRA